MTDYRNIFETALDEVYESAGLSGDEEFSRTVRERAVKPTKTNNVKWRKPTVIAASAAAAAVLTVSAGAALNWDIASLFTSRLDAVKEDNQMMMNSYYEFFPEEFDAEIPEGATAEMSVGEREYEILQAITHPIDETLEWEGYTVHIDGYAFDGSRLDIIYDVSYSDELNERIKENDLKSITDEDYDACLKYPVSFGLEVNGVSIVPGGNGDHVAEYDGKTEIRFELITEIPEGVTAAELKVKALRPAKAVIAAYDIDLTPPEGLSLDIDTELTRTLPDGVTETITGIRINPFGTTIDCTVDPYYGPSSDSPRARKAPIFLFYDDGTILDISGIGNNVVGHVLDSNSSSATVRLYISSRGNVIDVGRIKAIKIYNETIGL